jgi:hypothetical protein
MSSTKKVTFNLDKSEIALLYNNHIGNNNYKLRKLFKEHCRLAHFFKKMIKLLWKILPSDKNIKALEKIKISVNNDTINKCIRSSNNLYDFLLNNIKLQDIIDNISINDNEYTLIINLMFPKEFRYNFNIQISFSPEIHYYYTNIDPFIIKCKVILEDLDDDLPIPDYYDNCLYFNSPYDLIIGIINIRDNLFQSNI